MAITKSNVSRQVEASYDGVRYAAYPAGDKPAPDSGGGGGGDPSWQLDAGHYVSRKMDMVAVHPRPTTETPTWSRYRNAYPGIRYEIPISVQGGAWPLRYELVTGPSGMAIGETLSLVGDVLVPGANYGILYWDNPTTGTHSVEVKVYDQDYNRGDNPSTALTITFNLIVGTTGWLFVNPVNGDDTTGDGTISAPFKTLQKIHNDSSATTTHAGKRVYLRAGTVPLDGMATSSNNYRLDANTNPMVYIGYPGESVILEHYEGWFVHNAPHFWLSNVTEQFRSDYSPGGGTVPIYMHAVTQSGCTGYVTIYDVNFTAFKGSPANTGSGNTAIMYFNATVRNYNSITHNTVTGQAGPLIDTYYFKYSLVEANRVYNASLSTSDGSAPHIISMKDSPNYVTVRRNQMWEGLTNFPGAVSGIGCYDQGGIRNYEDCWNTVQDSRTSGRYGAFKHFGNNSVSALVENLYSYRNSIKGIWVWEGGSLTNMADDEHYIGKNVLQGGTINTSAKILHDDNVEGATVRFDSTMKLTGSARTSYLGTHGAEVA